MDTGVYTDLRMPYNVVAPASVTLATTDKALHLAAVNASLPCYLRARQAGSFQGAQSLGCLTHAADCRASAHGMSSTISVQICA